MEYLFVGHPVGAIHVSWIDEPDWTVNLTSSPRYASCCWAAPCAKRKASVHPVVLICRSGKRSREAGRALMQAGLKKVYNVTEGFEGDLDEQHHRSTAGGWRFRGLPWEQC
jgi:rhodanese-related sulfurtransferase